MRKFELLFVVFSLISCSQVDESPSSIGVNHLSNQSDFEYKGNGNNINRDVVSSFTASGITYKVYSISALEFLERKGETPSPEDRVKISHEQVLILEISTNENVTNIFDSKHLILDNEEAISYLSGGILEDIELTQNEKILEINGIQYDGSVSGANKIRVFLFTNQINTSELVSVRYYDNLFGSGFIKFKI